MRMRSGAPGDDLVPLAAALSVPRGVRFAFPECISGVYLPEEMGASVDVVDGDDVAVVQRGGGSRFLGEAAPAVGAFRTGMQHLDRDFAPQPRIIGFVDDTHAAAPQLAPDDVTRRQ